MTTAYRNIDRPNVPQAITVEFVRGSSVDDNADLSFLEEDYADVADEKERSKNVAWDRARLAAYYNGEWHMRGLWVEARINVPIGGGSFAMYSLRSPGLWGVESDCGADHENETWRDEESALRDALKQMAVAFAALPVQS